MSLPSTSTMYPRAELRFGAEAPISLTCTACSAPLGPWPARAVILDLAGDAVGGLCGECLTASADELSAHFEVAAEDFLSLASCFRTLADRARRRTLVKPTLGEWLLANQWAERDLLDSTGED